MDRFSIPCTFGRRTDATGGSTKGARERARKNDRKAGGGQPGATRSASTEIRKVQTRERPGGHPLRGSSPADGGRELVVPRGAGERSGGPHGLRASLRTHDVRRIAARAGQRAFPFP